MEQRSLGHTGRSVSALGLGCMGMSEFYGASEDSESLRTLTLALESGVTMFDTADTYGLGHNERLLGRFLSSLPATERPLVATKAGIVRDVAGGPRRIDNTPAYLRQACDASLDRLGVERLELWYLHRRDTSVPIEEAVGAMADLVAEGKVGAIGLSEVSAETLDRAHQVHPITAVQSEWSLWTREQEAALHPACRRLGVTFVAYSPLGRAMLTNAPPKPEELADGDFRQQAPRFTGAAYETNRRLVDQLAKWAETHDMTVAQTALAWLLAKEPTTIPLFGTRNPKRLRENVGAAACRLTAAQVAELDALFPPGVASGARYPDSNMAGVET